MVLHSKKRYIIFFLIINLIVLNVNNITLAQVQPEIKSPSAILIDAGTGTVLFDKNSHQRLEPASITKIMTLLLAFEALDQGKVKLEDKIKVSERAWKTGGSQVFLGPGEEQTLETLLKCITVASANDASVAVAEYIGGSVEGFVKMMNDKAKALGLQDTNFMNPHGLSEPNHYTSAYDVAMMSRELLRFHNFFTWSTVWMDYLEHTDKKRDATMLANTNKLLGKYEGLDGIKTGFHQKAGYCFAGTAKRGDFRLVSVVMGSENSSQRFEDTVKLLDYGFGHFNSVLIVKKGSVQKILRVEKGFLKEVNLIAESNLSVLTEKGKDSGINTKIEAPDKLFAPLNKGQVVGKIIAEQNGKKVGEVMLAVSQDVKKAGMLDMVKRILERWFNF